MRTILLSCLLLLLPLTLSGQQNRIREIELSFVASDDNAPIPRVICRLYDKTGRMVSHELSDSNGQLRLSLDTERVARLVCSRLGFERLEIPTSDIGSTKTKRYALRPKAAELKELIVRPPAIRQKKDTVIYDASEFLRKEDRYTADLLKRMPGLSVNSLGRIEYQGKPISHFYIEGKELLGANYDIATRTIDAKAIQNVEVLEGHQHAKILRDKVATEQAALNIKLKKEYKSRWQGEATLGTGLPIPLGSGKLSLMRFGNSQSLFALEGNNTGNSLLDTHGDLSISALAYSEVFLFGEEEVLNHNIGSSKIDNKYYLDNKSLRWTFNHLIKPQEESSLRINLLGSLEHKHYESYSSNSYATGAKLIIKEQQRERLRTLDLTPKISYEQNSSKLYLNNIFTANIRPSNLSDNITIPTSAIHETKRAKPLTIGNLFSTMIGIGKHMYSLKSNIRYYDQHERLGVAGTEQHLVASYRHRHLTTKNHIGSSWAIWGGRLESGLTAYYHYARYDTQLNEAHSLAHRDELQLDLSSGYRYRWASGELYLSLPWVYTYNYLKLDAHRSIRHNLFTPNPRLSIKYNPWYNVKLNLYTSIGRALESGAYYATIPIAHSYRYREQTPDILLPSSYWRTSASLEYKVPDILLFTYLSGSYLHSTKDYYIDYNYQAQDTQARIVNGRNSRQALKLDFQADKQFLAPKLKLKGAIGYTRQRYLMSQQGKSFDNVSHLYSANLSASWQRLSWLDIEANIGANISRHSSRLGNSPYISNYSSTLSIVLRPRNEFSSTLSMESEISEISSNRFVGTHFLNASLRYTWSKRLETRLTATNLLGKREYEVFSISGPNTSYYRLPLRGRELLLSFTFKL